MKLFPSLLFAVSLACVTLRAAEPVFVTAGGTALPARAFTNAAAGTVTAPLVFGGLGDTPAADWLGKVVLLDRGVISFADKVRKVKEAGGVAVIIANNLPGPVNDGTLAPETSAIPAVAVTQADGATLKTKAGAIVRVGAAAIASVLPDPMGRAGELVQSDGEKYILVKPLESMPGATMNGEADIGKPVSFSVSAAGSPPFTFQWLKDGATLPDATTAVMAIASVKASDAGSYTCLVSNAKGAVPSGAYNLTVKAAP